METKVQQENTDSDKIQKRRKYINNYFKTRYNTDPEFRERIKKHVLKSRAKKKEEYNAKQKAWRHANKEKVAEYMRNWREKNRERIREYKKEWAEQKRTTEKTEKERKKEKDL